MTYPLVAFGLLAHVLFWGAGLALLVLPQRWRRLWPVIAAPAGLALQSAAVWVGAHVAVAGTNVYAWPSLLLPVVLLAAALGRSGAAALGHWTGPWRLWLAMVAVLVGCVLPLGIHTAELTTTSIGGCDAADYAAGMRVFQEFSPQDRTGFIGQADVAGVLEVDNFFAHWMVLNHFTPSALLALNGTIFRLRPHEITGIFTAVLAVLIMPGVWLLARSTLRYRPWVALLIAMLVGASPLLLYAVYQVATAQIIAAIAVNLLVWAGLQALQASGNWRRAAAWAPLLIGAFWLLLGGYNFFILVCGAPLGGAVLWWLLRRRAWGRVARWGSLILVSLVVAGLFAWERVQGLGLRFRLFDEVPYGWRIPLLGPAGWAGQVVSSELAPGNFAMAVLLGGALVVAWILALVRRGSRNERQVWTAAGLVLFPLLGYGLLALKSTMPGNNSSYDAYKLLAVFHGCILTGLLAWLGWGSGRAGVCVKTGALALVLVTLHGGWLLGSRVAAGPLQVDRQLAALSEVEGNPAIGSVNILARDMWTRLWANAFLLRKQQYFSEPTYEGRRPTPLRGDWDLRDGLFSVRPVDGGGYVAVGRRLYLLRRDSPGYLRLDPGDGWYQPEQHSGKADRWIWTKGNAKLEVDNPHREARAAAFRLTARGLENREVQLWVNGQQSGAASVGLVTTDAIFPTAMIPPGVTTLELRSPTPPNLVSGDNRPLELCVYGFALEEAPAGK